MKNNSADISSFLAERKKQSLYRSLKISETAQQPVMRIDGRDCLSFCSNDYLGLANHPKIVKAFKSATDIYGVGSGASHLINGHSKEHQKLEEALAEFTGRDKALLFSNGYMANMGVINALLERGDFLFQDRLNHASLIDAGLLSNAKMQRYLHNDVNHLSKLLDKAIQASPSKTSMIVTDGVFSMDGDEAPINDLIKSKRKNDSWLMVDDAHGFGVLGQTGAGLLEQENASQDDVPVLMATLGKACGTSGAFVAGSEDLIEYLKQTARTFIYTTAMPSSIAAASIESLKIIKEESWRRSHLKDLIGRFKSGAKQLGIPLMESNTAIQPILLNDSKKTVQLSQALEELNILVTAIRPPTVPEGSSRLRVTFSASHKMEHVDKLLDVLETVN